MSNCQSITRLPNYPITRFPYAASTNVDALIKVLAGDFGALVSSTIVPLNSFQTSGNSPGAARLGSPARRRVGSLGFGTLGSAIARRLTGPDSPSSLQLTHICDRRARENRRRQPEARTWTDGRAGKWIVRIEATLNGAAHAVLSQMDASAMRSRTRVAPVLREPAEIRGLNDPKLAEAV